MRTFIRNYREKFTNLINSIQATDIKGNKIDTPCGIEIVCGLIKKRYNDGGKMLFVGNGGSASIASHMAIDFWKNGGIKSMSFNDGSLLTCISNDYGFQHVFEKPIEMFAEKQDVLFAISSSGRSENILNAVRSARAKGCAVITLSGFAANNPLSSMGDYNFYVQSDKYGMVEVAHQYICHFILDAILSEKAK